MAVQDRIISIIGCGPGSPDYVAPVARDAAIAAEVLVGTERLLDLFPGVSAERIACGTGLEEILDHIEANLDPRESPCW